MSCPSRAAWPRTAARPERTVGDDEREAAVRGVEPGHHAVTREPLEQKSSHRAPERDGGRSVLVERLGVDCTAGAAIPPLQHKDRKAAADAASRSGDSAPRLPDGNVNFGRVPGEKGVWAVPHHQHGDAGRRKDGQLLPEIQQAQAAARAGAEAHAVVAVEAAAVDRSPSRGCRGCRGRRQSTTTTRRTRSKRPGRLLPPARWSEDDGHAVLPDGDHPAARAQAHPHDLRRCDASGARSTWTAASSPKATS